MLKQNALRFRDIHTISMFLFSMEFYIKFVAGINPVSSNEQPPCPYHVNEEIQQCVQPVANYAKLLNQQEDSSASSSNSSELGKAIQLPKIGGKVFEKLCRLIRQFETCVQNHRQKCGNHITISLIEASYGYLCNNGYDIFMHSAECLMELDQQPSVKQCHDVTLRNIEKANSQDEASVPKKLDEMCRALNSFSTCVMNPIRVNCGSDAWQVIFRVLRDTTRTLMPSCVFNNSNRQQDHLGDSTNPDEHITAKYKESLRTRGHHGRLHHRHQYYSNTTSTFASILPVSESERINKQPITSNNNDRFQMSAQQSQQSSATNGEGNLRYIQVEVDENRLPNPNDDDFYPSSNHRRKFRNETNSSTLATTHALNSCFIIFLVIIFSKSFVNKSI